LVKSKRPDLIITDDVRNLVPGFRSAMAELPQIRFSLLLLQAFRLYRLALGVALSTRTTSSTG
jgi:hypothetical protein